MSKVGQAGSIELVVPAAGSMLGSSVNGWAGRICFRSPALGPGEDYCDDGALFRVHWVRTGY